MRFFLFWNEQNVVAFWLTEQERQGVAMDIFKLVLKIKINLDFDQN